MAKDTALWLWFWLLSLFPNQFPSSPAHSRLSLHPNFEELPPPLLRLSIFGPAPPLKSCLRGLVLYLLLRVQACKVHCCRRVISKHYVRCSTWSLLGNLLFSPDITLYTPRDCITWLGCRQPWPQPPTQIVNQSLNTYLIFCNHACLNLHIQQVISPAYSVQLTPFLLSVLS